MLKQRFSLESWLNVLLYLGFIIIIALMIASLSISIESASSIKSYSQTLHNRQIQKTVNLLKLEQYLTLSFSQLSTFITTNRETDKIKFNETLDKVIVGINMSFHDSKEPYGNFSDIISLLEKYKEKSGEVISLAGNTEKNFIGIFRAAKLLNPHYLKFVSIMEQLIDDELSNDDEINVEVLSALVKTRSSWYRMIMSLRVYFTTKGELDFNQFKLFRELNDRDFERLYSLKEQLDFNSESISELKTIRDVYLGHLPEVLSFFKDDKWRYDIYLLKTEIYPLMSDILTQLRQIVEDSEIQTTQQIDFMQSEINDQVWLSKIIFAVSITFGISIVLVVGRNVSKIAKSLAKSKYQASQNLIKANERAYELELTSEELQSSLNALQQTQTQLIESEKMAALGGLVAGISHEINTPIGISITSSSFQYDEIVKLKQLYDSQRMSENDFEDFIKNSLESTSIINTNLKRAADLIRSFKQIAVDQTSEEYRSFNLKTYLDEIILSLKPNLKKKEASINITCPKDINLNSYPGVYSQIMTNLILNSIVHGFENRDNGSIAIHVNGAEDQNGSPILKISYSDDGVGIPTDIKNKIFEPFYTTKRNIGGSGIGMSLVYNLVTQKLRGNIELNSKPGSGAHFTIVVPKDIPNPLLVK